MSDPQQLDANGQKPKAEKPMAKSMSPATLALVLALCLAVGIGAPAFYEKFEQQIKLSIIGGLICH